MSIKTKHIISFFTIVILIVACSHDIANFNPLLTSRLNDTVAKTPFDSTLNNALGCDTTKINYVEHIKPIMTKYCTSCHSSTLKLGGYDLSNYAGTLIPAKSGKLYGSVLHAVGFSPMPSTNLFISTCEASLIKRWIDQSYLVDSAGSKDTTVLNQPITPSVNTCSLDTVYFASQILPLMTSSCAMSGCHDAISRREGIQMTDYANIMKIVRAGSPSNSKLYKSLVDSDPENKMPLPPIPYFTTAQVDLVYKWILQGAKNNSCINTSTANCTTTNMSYSKDIQPIFASNCNGCHNATAPSGGINLTTYNGTIAISARLVGSITHAAGYSPMPTSTIQLNTCEINKISAWIQQGKINN